MKTINIEEARLLSVSNKIDILRERINVECKQEYENPLKEAVDINYFFPIQNSAAIYCFELEMNGEKYIGELKEKNEADLIYKKVKNSGDMAIQMVKRNNDFTLKIANILPGAKFTIIIKYVDILKANNNKYRLDIPTNIQEKYDNSMTKENTKEQLKLIDKFLHKDKIVTSQWNVNFEINIFGCENIKIISDHDLKIKEFSDYVKITGNNIVPNRSLVLEYEAPNNNFNFAARKNGNIYSTYNIIIPENENKKIEHNKNYTFLMDNSGSMSGENLEIAKNILKLCIRNLDETDKFNIAFFNSSYEYMAEDFILFSDKNLEIADAFIDKVSARGGTEINSAIASCINKPNNTIILFTDGQVYNTESIYNLVKNKAIGTRVFCFGIDKSIDAYFLNKLAELGEGTCEFLIPGENIYDKTILQMIKTFISPEKIKINDKEIIAFGGTSIYSFGQEDFKDINITTEDGNNIVIKQIARDDLYDFMNAVYYYEKIKNEPYTYFNQEEYNKNIIDYSLKGHVLCDKTSYIVVKENEDKVIAKTECILFDNIERNTFEVQFARSAVSINNASINCMCETSAMNNTAKFAKRKNITYSAIDTFSDNCEEHFNDNKTILDIIKEAQTVTANNIEELKELINKSNERELTNILLILFTKQKTDGSILEDKELTEITINLYERLNKPVAYKLQAEKIKKFLKK